MFQRQASEEPVPPGRDVAWWERDGDVCVTAPVAVAGVFARMREWAGLPHVKRNRSKRNRDPRYSDDVAEFARALHRGDFGPFVAAPTMDLHEVFRRWRRATYGRDSTRWSDFHYQLLRVSHGGFGTRRARYTIDGATRGPHGIVVHLGDGGLTPRLPPRALGAAVESFRRCNARLLGDTHA